MRGAMNDTLAKRIYGRRKELGLSMQELARRVGVNWQAIQKLENGGAKSTRHMLALARALEVNPDWLQTGEGDQKVIIPPLTDVVLPNVNWVGRGELVPVMGTVKGGKDGFVEWNGEVIDRVPRPPFLANAKDGYALFVTGDSMAPRYEQGEIVYIHPGKPVGPGDFVVVQLRAHDGSPPGALVKRLVRRNGESVILQQFNPEKRITIPAADVVAIHKIVGSGEG